MNKINTNDHKYITGTVTKILSQNHIITVLDFLREDAEKLSIITKLSLAQIIEIRNAFFTKYSSPLVNGTDLFIKNLSLIKHVCTGLEKLDTILSGGIPIGQITEICGLAGSGKSQLCMQIAINCVKKSNETVLYIDTKGDFSAVRVNKILASCGLSYKDMAQIMLKIKIVNIWTLESLVDFVKNIKNNIIVIDNLALIIIDSLPTLMFQHFSDDSKIGLKFLNTLVSDCRSISKKHRIAILCVNIETRWVEQDVPNLDDDDETTAGMKETTYIERKTRCMGKYWQHIPAVVINVERKLNCDQDDSINCFQISVTANKYNIPQIIMGQCMLSVNSAGVK